MVIFAALMAVLVALVLVASYRHIVWLEWLAKPAASATFIAAAIWQGALGSTYGIVLAIGLVLAAAGDVFLIPKNKKTFLLGLVAFLLGHVAYGIAFALRGIDLFAFGISLGAMALVAFPVLRWLWPNVRGSMRAPVASYVIVITTMVALSIATFVRHGDPRLPIGALAFYLSDLSVARNRFVKESFANRAWGLPLYFGSQLVLAWTTN